MTKKLPKVYKASDNIKAVNESWYSSYIKREDDISQNVLLIKEFMKEHINKK